jgi:hypothetical protein
MSLFHYHAQANPRLPGELKAPTGDDSSDFVELALPWSYSSIEQET